MSIFKMSDNIVTSHKYYAVANGRKCGIYNSWKECQEQISGVSNAKYKSFNNEADAQNYINNNTNKEKQEDTNRIKIYVDGSFDNATKRYSYGMVVLDNDTIIHEQAEAFDNEELASYRNIAGELVGAIKAMEYCIKHCISDMSLYYDYSGIENWCTEAWQTNKPLTIQYKYLYDTKFKDYINISFFKVEGHTGIEYNEKVDILAKSALGLI